MKKVIYLACFMFINIFFSHTINAAMPGNKTEYSFVILENANKALNPDAIHFFANQIVSYSKIFNMPIHNHTDIPKENVSIVLAYKNNNPIVAFGVLKAHKEMCFGALEYILHKSIPIEKCCIMCIAHAIEENNVSEELFSKLKQFAVQTGCTHGLIRILTKHNTDDLDPSLVFIKKFCTKIDLIYKQDIHKNNVYEAAYCITF